MCLANTPLLFDVSFPICEKRKRICHAGEQEIIPPLLNAHVRAFPEASLRLLQIVHGGKKFATGSLVRVFPERNESEIGRNAFSTERATMGQ